MERCRDEGRSTRESGGFGFRDLGFRVRAVRVWGLGFRVLLGSSL